MAKRLTELYPINTVVEIQFSRDAQSRWFTGTVVAHQAPAIWVQLSTGDRFFVTNGRRIRPRSI